MDAEDVIEPAAGRPLISKRTMEVAVGAVLLLFGATFLYSSYRLGFRWQSDGPETGFFPFYVSLFICGASIAVLYQAFSDRSRGPAAPFIDTLQLKRVLSVLIPALVYVLGIQAIGIYVASAIYITLFMRLLGKYSWVKSVALGVIINLIFFGMFELWFRVPLYKGIWDPTAWAGF